jgi:hypothetical protein
MELFVQFGLHNKHKHYGRNRTIESGGSNVEREV